MEELFIPTEIIMKDKLKIVKQMVKVCMFKMILHIKEILKIIFNLEKEFNRVIYTNLKGHFGKAKNKKEF